MGRFPGGPMARTVHSPVLPRTGVRSVVRELRSHKSRGVAKRRRNIASTGNKVSVQLLSHVRLCANPWITARQASLSITNSWSFYPNPCPLSQWCHPTISSSVVPFSFCPQSLPASGSLPMSQLFAWGGQSTGVSASTSVLPITPMTDLL